MLKHSKPFLNEFKANLKPLSAELVVEPKMVIRSNSSSQVEPVSWTKEVQTLLSDYENNRLKERYVSIPAHLRNEKEITDLKTHMKRYYESSNSSQSLKYEIKNGSKNDTIRVMGATVKVELFCHDVKSKFVNLDHNIKDRIRRKLDLTINKKSYPLFFDVLSSFNGVYLKDFSVFLLKYEASIEKTNSDKGFVVKCTNEKNLQNEK
jgi:hypothetical protein